MRGDSGTSPTSIRSAGLMIVLLSILTGCASLGAEPAAEPGHVVAPPVAVVVEGRQGLQDEARSRQAIEQAEAEGRSRAFKAHLARLTALGETLSSNNSVDLLIDGPATFDAMFDAIKWAEHRVFVESYIFEDTDIGKKMRTHLLAKKAQGLDVRIIYDGVGALTTSGRFFDSLREGGIEVCEFNPVGVDEGRAAPLDVNHRDHRKLLLIDDKIAFVGGVNISSVYSRGSFSRDEAASDEGDSGEGAGWRDTHARLSGPVALELLRGYEDTWHRQACGGPPFDLPERDAGQAEPTPGEPDDRLVLAILSQGDGDSGRFYRALLGAIETARSSIHITMAYFVPNPTMLDALKAAARRGVDTQLVLPGKSDSLLVLRAGQARYDDLLDAGVKIFERHDRFLHAKTAVIDGVWSTVGSSNLDWRSFLHNDEVNVVILGREVGQQMDALFAKDREAAERVTREAWSDRGLGRRVMEMVGQVWQYWL